jgi:hypothetical protein
MPGGTASRCFYQQPIDGGSPRDHRRITWRSPPNHLAITAGSPRAHRRIIPVCQGVMTGGSPHDCPGRVRFAARVRPA